jgi:leucyl aminopeptidase
MTVTTTTTAPEALTTDLLLVPIPEAPGPAVRDDLARLLGPARDRMLDDLDGAPGSTCGGYPEAAAARRVVLLGLGPADEIDAEALRVAVAAGSGAARDAEAEDVAVLLPPADGLDDARAAQAAVEGALLGAYRYRAYKTEDNGPGPARLTLHGGTARDAAAVEQGAARGRRLAMATGTARDLVNRAPADKTAQVFADLVAESGATHGYDVETWDEDRIRNEGMGGLLAVNRGSYDPPTFSILDWRPDAPLNDRPVVVVGKGVMFDTGGLSLKNTKGSMDKMKSDMAGAAAVVGLFEALAGLDVPLHVVGLLPATDNRPGRKAYVPGDVIDMHSGATVEVMNTDAEGRLLLADALSYATDAYDPALLLDLATLTGSAIVALGHQAAGVMTSETDAAAERLYALQRAGERTGERVHPLPMYDDYTSLLDSDVADLKNVGGSTAGAITAAKFLEHFVEAPWMHLDIAGPAFLDTPDGYRPAGGTGFGVRLLTAYLENDLAARKQA